jgi:predicted MFS family arabinose efflux permease
MGINLTIARVGSVAADNSRSWAAGLFTGWQPPLLLAAGIGGLCIVSGVVYGLLERRAERRYALGHGGSTDKLVLADLVRFGRGYFWVVGLCVTFYSAIFPFRRFANIFFIDARGVSPETAGFLNGLLPLTAMVATPLFGLLADRIGKRALLMALGSVMLLPVFLLLAYTPLPIGVPVAMMGISFSLIPAVMWPSVAYLVDEKKLGTAYALMTLCQQIGWAVISWAIGGLNDLFHASAQNPGGYGAGMWLFSTLGFLGLFFSWRLHRHETRTGGSGLETITTGS